MKTSVTESDGECYTQCDKSNGKTQMICDSALEQKDAARSHRKLSDERRQSKWSYVLATDCAGGRQLRSEVNMHAVERLNGLKSTDCTRNLAFE